MNTAMNATTEQRQENGYLIFEHNGKFGIKNAKNDIILNPIYSSIKPKQEKLGIYETFKEKVVIGKKIKGGKEVDIIEEKEISKEIGKRTINVVKCEIIESKNKDEIVYSIENPDKLTFLRRHTIK